MKKVFSFLATALMSLTMMAGPNDLLWDYTQTAIPTTSPDHGLYYAGYVNDAPSTNNGLNGVKLDSSGWAYFEKAPVAGKLKLTFANRKAQTAYAVSIYNATKAENEAPVKGTKIIDTDDIDFGASTTIDLSAEVTGILIERKTGAEGVLSKIQFTEDVPRTFVNFKIELRDNPYTVIEPAAGLPEGVIVDCPTYNGGQHGVQGGTITVPVDGMVKFTIGGCQFSNSDITVKKDGVDYATISNKVAACGETAGSFAQNVTYMYLGDAGVLTFEFGSQTYVPYFFAEATDIMPCEIIFKDQNGQELSRVETFEGATLESLPDPTTLSITEGDVFRGWFYSNGKKAVVGDPITGNTTIQAKVTPIESVTVGSVQTYDFASQIFYPEDHETVIANGGAFHDAQHGWYFNADGSIDVQVAGNAVVVVTLCKYSESGNVRVMDGEQELATYPVVKNETPDGTELTAQYAGNGGWLTINWDAKQYIHRIVVYNVLDFLEKDQNTGYFIVPAGDAASLLMALVQAEPGDKIFLPNGEYDLGETVLTTISKNNISLIGQSMDGVIIRNAPDAKTESIDKTATIKINKNVTGTYLQDLTIQNALDYYKNNNGRAVALWDQGTQTVCKNVKLLSYQDTYYSNLQGAVKYFQDCEIHGTVDFICGDGSVYFYGTELVCEQRSTSGGGSDAITASNADVNDRGYVFDHCTVRYAEGIQGTLPVVSFGRAWNNSPKTVFLYTFLDDSNGAINMNKDASAQKDKISRWTLGAMNALPHTFGEYYSVNGEGQNVTPESNNVTFVLGTSEKQMETVLTADQAATYTLDYTLGTWANTAVQDATQAVCEATAAQFEPNGIYLVEANGLFAGIILGSEFMDRFAVYDGVNYTARKANARGGFGLKAGEQQPGEAVEQVSGNQTTTTKILRNGQVLIQRDGRMFNMLGTEIK